MKKELLKTFEESQKLELDKEAKKVLHDLGMSRQWLTLKSVIEDYILKLTFNLLVGTESEKDSSFEELKRLRGFVYYYNKIKNVVEKEEEKDGERK